MPKGKDARADKAFEMYKQGLKLIEIANQLGIAEGTVRSWKNRYKWDSNRSATLQKKEPEKKCNVAKKKKDAKKAVADEVIAVTQNTELTDKQQFFCIYYIRCFNATKAYQKAYGCDYATAVVNGPRLLGNAKVKEEIFRLKQERLNREFLSEEDIFQKYMDIAFADISDYMEWGQEETAVMGPFGPIKDEDGNVIKQKINTVRFKESGIVDGTIISEVKQGKGGVSLKLADRMKALQWLTDHMDMATEKQRAEIALLKAKADAGKNDKEDKLDKLFEQIEGVLKDVE